MTNALTITILILEKQIKFYISATILLLSFITNAQAGVLAGIILMYPARF